MDKCKECAIRDNGTYASGVSGNCPECGSEFVSLEEHSTGFYIGKCWSCGSYVGPRYETPCDKCIEEWHGIPNEKIKEVFGNWIKCRYARNMYGSGK